MPNFGWSYPPGVSNSDLPGNSKAEQEEEALGTLVYELLGEDTPDDVVNKIIALWHDAFNGGYQQALADAAEAAEAAVVY